MALQPRAGEIPTSAPKVKIESLMSYSELKNLNSHLAQTRPNHLMFFWLYFASMKLNCTHARSVNVEIVHGEETGAVSCRMRASQM